MKKLYPIFGIIGPIIYILAVIVGGAIRSDYSFLYNTISELTITDAPNVVLISILFGIYNFSILIFGTGAFLDEKIDHSRKYKTATLMLAIIGLLGLLLLFFPQYPRNAAITFQGTIHIILAGITSLLTLISVLLMGLNFRKYEETKNFSFFSFIFFIIILISGGVAAVSVGSNSPFGGLFERITIFAFMIWIIVFSYLIIKKT